MKLEQQVCSLESAKRLRELGVPQESLFNWIDFIEYGWLLRDCHGSHCRDEVSAFTAGELGEMLPFAYFPIKHWSDCKWTISYLEPAKVSIMADTEAEARAKMLIYLLENKIMEAPNAQAREGDQELGS